jgi:hypothetical protein
MTCTKRELLRYMGMAAAAQIGWHKGWGLENASFSIVQGQLSHQQSGISVTSDFPGGNIVVDHIDGSEVRLHQDLRDTLGWWFYWYFAVHGDVAQTLTFDFTNKAVIGVRGPAVSTDDGKSWTWLGATTDRESSFTYAIPSDVREARFCLAVPYVEDNLRTFLQRYAGHPHLRIDRLCRSRKGRSVELLRLGRLDGKASQRVLLTARNHACEMMASYSLEGVMESILADDESAKWLNEHVEFMVIPFVDKDGVEDGDQGKNRRPHDHGRDYIQGIYPEVRAIQALVPHWSGGRLRIALDLHCPELRARNIYFVGISDQNVWARVVHFCQILEGVQKGPLLYSSRNNLPYGTTWNIDPGPGLLSCANWAATIPHIALASAIEIPYADVGGIAVTAETARSFGHDLARAIHQQLREPKA